MEYNKDESFRCLELAQSYLAKEDYDKALKFIIKSKRLYPLKETQELLERVKNCMNAKNHTVNPEYIENDKTEKLSHNQPKKTSDYTAEQVEAVRRIKQSKNYYEIFGATKYASDLELKRKYRKLALEFHPDKNQAPGAAEAFKLIGKAFSILNDPEKRRKYDSSEAKSSTYPYTFTPDTDSDDVFSNFFDGNSGKFPYHSTAHTFRRHYHLDQENWPKMLMQLSPLIAIVLITVCCLWFVPDEPYSLSPDSEFTEKRITDKLGITYYVKPGFTNKYYDNAVKRVGNSVEARFINDLRQECHKEKALRDRLSKHARSRSRYKPTATDMSSCKELRKYARDQEDDVVI